MIRLGLKLTHDGGLAVLDGTTLLFSHEAEKSANLPRHAALEAIDVAETLSQYGMTFAAVDRVVVDGWIDGRAPFGPQRAVPVAPYHERDGHRDPLHPLDFEGLSIGGVATRYRSYAHVAGHALGTYATSPWAGSGAPALILVWDGAMLPRLYRFDPAIPTLTPLRPLLGFVGHVYPVFCSYFGPFVPGGGPPQHDSLPKESLLDLSGKAMAWAGLGEVNDDLLVLFERVYKETLDLRWEFVFDFARMVHERIVGLGVRDEDVVASFQAYVGRKLVEALAAALGRAPELPRRLCFTGGCALNIVWNAALRGSALFDEVWVPPFPNDAGSALGAAVADLIHDGEGSAIDWDVYRGPELVASRPAPGWTGAPCDIAELAALLHQTGEPVVFLHGRAELGPRALGNRSILCSAERPEAKDRLNEIKRRAWYRPVAPVCLEADAPTVFEPGSEDPYMLYTHTVRPLWRERVPAIVHVDGSARLQTIRDDQNPLLAGLLSEYHHVSGIPLLCNTSGNLSGSGFFPDLRSATEWGRTPYVWCDHMLYSRNSEAAAAA